MTEQKIKCGHPDLALIHSRIDGKWFFHCPSCRTVLGPNFETRDKAERWARKHKNEVPRYTVHW